MKQQIVNIIELIDGIIESVDSFIIDTSNLNEDEALLKEKEIIDKAEALFIAKAKENGLTDEDVDGCLDNGYYEKGSYFVNIFWSSVK